MKFMVQFTYILKNGEKIMCLLWFAADDEAEELQTPEEKFPHNSETLDQSELQSFFPQLHFHLFDDICHTFSDISKIENFYII